MIGDGDCEEIGGMKISRGNRSTLRKPTPAPLCPPQIPHDLHMTIPGFIVLNKSSLFMFTIYGSLSFV
jgi:hypothetical protein